LKEALLTRNAMLFVLRFRTFLGTLLVATSDGSGYNDASTANKHVV
jgi:hypothetical protein